MLFLKKFYAYGFKSFAEEINISFNNDMTGIVGPNGSGKSNIVDAFKWVLGEQSIKDMRGNSKLDLIFKGSSSHPESKFAQVTLTFDNSNKVLHYDKDQISITRKLFRDSGANEYYINNEPARLKDIQMIFTDTGLSKGSLGIISQGTVNGFSEAKAESRRKMFEEAAGIGMYSVQKAEALRHLDRAEQSLATILVMEKELERDLRKLLKQAENVKIYREKFDRLKELDLTILVKDISHFKHTKDKLDVELISLEEKNQLLEPKELEIKSKLEFSKQKLQEADENINLNNKALFEINDVIASLDKKQLLLNSKLESSISGNDINTKIKAYEQLIVAHKEDINNYSKRIEELKSQIETYSDIYGSLNEKRTEIHELINSLNIQYTEQNTKFRIYKDQIERNSNQSFGVKSILENKAALKGVYDVVAKYITVDTKYEISITKALGKSISNLIVESSENAKHAIHFLKQNNAGQATFLPLREIKPKFIREEHLDVLTELDGFVGIASKLINIEPKMQTVIDALIGQVIIADTIDSAIRISKYVFELYKIISLDGDIVYPGGAITGGSERLFASPFNLEKHRDELEQLIAQTNEKLLEAKITHQKVSSEFIETEVKLNEKKFALHTLVEKLSEATKNFDKYKTEYEVLTNKAFDSNKVVNENEIKKEINELLANKAKINENLNIATKNKLHYSSETTEFGDQLEELRLNLDKVRSALSTTKQDLIKCNNFYDNAKNRINETYTMTLEYAIENFSNPLPVSDEQAREFIYQLRADIDALGPINPKAIEELDEKQQKYDVASENRKEAEESIHNIKLSITQLDKSARAKFAKVIEDVNNTLPEIFKFLFGGGTCAVTFSDPENILESGIEVMAHPPGKRISNLKLLSGGEKTLVAISVLFAILKTSSFPIVILDEAEAALDIANVERFAQIIRKYSTSTQFLVITHRPGTMKECKVLLGATMQNPGVTNFISVSLDNAIEMIEKDD